MTNFLNNYAYQNAITQDLMDEFDAVSSQGLDVTRVRDRGLTNRFVSCKC